MFAEEKPNANRRDSIRKDNGFRFKRFAMSAHKLGLKLGKWRKRIDQKSVLIYAGVGDTGVK